MDEFRAILIEGKFSYALTPLQCETLEGQVVDIHEALLPFEGTRVRFAAHHLPPMPPDLSQWGGGCCRWQAFGSCPAGHHERPTWLYNVSLEGILAGGRGEWVVETFDGMQTAVPLARMMTGHAGRIAVASVVSVEKMREALEAAGEIGSVEELAGKASNLRDILDRLRGKGRG